MRTIDVGTMIVAYNFVIGVLLMLASQQTARYVSVLGMGAKVKVERVDRLHAVKEPVQAGSK